MAQKQESQVPRESAEELMIRRFTGAQRDGIGRFFADPVSGRWSWSDAAYEIFGYQAGSVTPSWNLIISHIPAEDRAVAQAAYELARTRNWTVQLVTPHPCRRCHALDPDTWGDLRFRGGKLNQSGGITEQ